MVANTSLLGDYKVHSYFKPLDRPHLVRFPDPLMDFNNGLGNLTRPQHGGVIIDHSGHWRGVRAGGGAEPAPETTAPQISVKENVSTSTLCLVLKYKKRRITNMCRLLQ